MANHLQKITARAKQIRKAHPKKAWTECIKAASRELKKGGKIGAAPKKAAKAAKVSRSKAPKKAAARKTGMGSISATAQICTLKASVARLEAAIKAGGRSMPAKEKVEMRKRIKVYKANITNYKKLL